MASSREQIADAHDDLRVQGESPNWRIKEPVHGNHINQGEDDSAYASQFPDPECDNDPSETGLHNAHDTFINEHCKEEDHQHPDDDDEHSEKSVFAQATENCTSSMVVTSVSLPPPNDVKDDDVSDNKHKRDENDQILSDDDLRRLQCFIYIFMICSNVLGLAPSQSQDRSSTLPPQTPPHTLKSTGFRILSENLEEELQSGIASEGIQESGNDEEVDRQHVATKKKKEVKKKKQKIIRSTSPNEPHYTSNSIPRVTGVIPFDDNIPYGIQETEPDTLDIALAPDRGGGTVCIEELLPYGVKEQNFGCESELCLHNQGM